MINPPFLIASAEVSGIGAYANAERSARLFDGMLAMGLAPITVDYWQENIPRTAYIVPIEDKSEAYKTLLEALWSLYEQNSALYVSHTARAYLDRPGEPTEILGRWVEVDPFKERLTGYISDPDGRYWAVRP